MRRVNVQRQHRPALRLVTRPIRYWSMVREAQQPRWQSRLIDPLMQWIGHHRLLSPDGRLMLEWGMRQALGQPLCPAAWNRMTFNDKVVYRRLRGRDPILKIFCDKLRMREFVAERLGADSLPRLLTVSEDPSQFSALTGPYVLKANHGSGMVTIVGDGQVASDDQLAEAAAWLDTDFPWEREWGYRGARRLLLAEELLRSPEGSSPPPDYKLFTFDGEVRMIQVVMGRFTARHSWMLKWPDWSDIEATYGGQRALDDGQKPAHLDRMIEWASQLGRGIDFVRVDMYDVGDRVLVGELTPYPAAGKKAFDPATTDAWLGRFWRRPQAGLSYQRKGRRGQSIGLVGAGSSVARRAESGR